MNNNNHLNNNNYLNNNNNIVNNINNYFNTNQTINESVEHLLACENEEKNILNIKKENDNFPIINDIKLQKSKSQINFYRKSSNIQMNKNLLKKKKNISFLINSFYYNNKENNNNLNNANIGMNTNNHINKSTILFNSSSSGNNENISLNSIINKSLINKNNKIIKARFGYEKLRNINLRNNKANKKNVNYLF